METVPPTPNLQPTRTRTPTPTQIHPPHKKALAEATGRKEAAIKKDYEDKGDLGAVAAASRSAQKVLFKPAALSVAGVFKKFREIALASGQKSQEKKRGLIKQLLVAAAEEEPGWVVGVWFWVEFESHLSSDPSLPSNADRKTPMCSPKPHPPKHNLYLLPLAPPPLLYSYVIRSLQGKLRIGLAEQSLLAALAHAVSLHRWGGGGAGF
jgi:hypothetical protein